MTSAGAPMTNAGVMPTGAMPTGTGTSESSVARLATRLLTDAATPSGKPWKLHLPGLTRKARIDLSEDWLGIAVPLRAVRCRIDTTQITEMLSQNSALVGAPRIVGLGSDRSGLGLGRRREIAIDVPRDTLSVESDEALTQQLDRLVESLTAAAESCRRSTRNEARPRTGETAGVRAQDDAASFDENAVAPIDNEFCLKLNELGWSLRETGENGYEVPLEVPATYVAANVVRHHDGVSLQVSGLAADTGVASGICRDAVATLLWLVANRTRMVRASRCGEAFCLSVALPTEFATPTAVAHACSALSVALQQFLPEAERLGVDQRLAHSYLRTIGIELRPEVSAPPTAQNAMADGTEKEIY